MATPHMGRVLGGFQDQLARRLTGRLPRRQADWKWEYTSAEASRAEAGFENMETYIRRRNKTVEKYIATQLLLDLCAATERTQWERVGMQWWEQAVINMEGEKEATAAAEVDGMEE